MDAFVNANMILNVNVSHIETTTNKTKKKMKKKNIKKYIRVKQFYSMYKIYDNKRETRNNIACFTMH